MYEKCVKEFFCLWVLWSQEASFYSLFKKFILGIIACYYFKFVCYRLRNIRYCFNTLCLVLFWRLFIANSTIAKNSWSFILGLVYKFVQFFRITSTIKTPWEQTTKSWNVFSGFFFFCKEMLYLLFIEIFWKHRSAMHAAVHRNFHLKSCYYVNDLAKVKNSILYFLCSIIDKYGFQTIVLVNFTF